MSRDAAIESWLASMSKKELIDECFFWHDMALYQGRMYNAVKDDNVKLLEMVRQMWFGLYCPTEPTDGCPQCPFNSDGDCFFEQRMNELGYEGFLRRASNLDVEGMDE